MTVQELEDFLAGIKSKQTQVTFRLNTTGEELDALLDALPLHAHMPVRINLAVTNLAITTAPTTVSFDLEVAP